MITIHRGWLVYGLLAAAFASIVGWQVFEHARVQRAGRAALVNRVRDISTTLERVVRSQQFGGGMVSKERLESALTEIAKAAEIKSILMFNAAGAVVASAGDPVKPEATNTLHEAGERWGERTVTLANLIDLGGRVELETNSPRPIIILPRRDPSSSTNSEWRNQWFRRRPGERDSAGGTNAPPRFAPPPDGAGPPPGPPPELGSGELGPRGPNRFSFRRPPWISEEEYRALIEKQGLHSFVVVLSTESLQAARRHDFWLRMVIGILGAVASAGLAVAWRNVEKSSDLQFRLLRASEMNNHLKEMNIAAAGLAHETRNPLNIIRGLAQIISNQADASVEVRSKSRAITDEVDRITAQLNEFMSYSKPREVRRAPVRVGAVSAEIGRALQYDLEDKSIRFSIQDEGLVIEADEQLLRQVLFNLILNAIQAAESGGEIQVIASRAGASEAILDVRDNGPGVAPSQREEIFKPYFTTHQKGTGLGLAVVQQIVLAHGWEIQCLSNEPKGAIFRLKHIRLSPTS